MKRIMSFGDFVFETIIYILVILIGVSCILPFIHVIASSFTKPEIIMSYRGLNLWPKEFTVQGYQLVFQNLELFRGFRNTLLYVVVGTSISLAVNVLAGFALSRKNVMWSRPILLFASFTMLFSGGLIPFYILVQRLGWINTLWAVTVPGAVNIWHLIILRTSFQAIPDSLEESAKLDGANDFVVLTRIIIPLSMPVIAVIILYNVVGHWNAWFNATIFLQKRVLYPLQLLLKEILIQNDTSKMVNQAAMPQIDFASMDRFRPLVRYCITVVATLPIVCAYPFLQKYFIKGVLIGSIKG
ncbi:sugar ABC transporter permease [Spirochaetia bacterium]|nr:sugar ABC transporter permease [Spirochaetia bacterium]